MSDLYLCELAWLGGRSAEERVLIEVNGERIASVRPSMSEVPERAVRLPGLTLPGLANAHSHAFHRALRAQDESRAGSFWSWRSSMYRLAERLDPDSYLALARATYAEMALAGMSLVGEFHYLHHGRGGSRYENPAEFSQALTEAARTAGVRLTLLDALYLATGFNGATDPAQSRFFDANVEEWAARTESIDEAPGMRTGAAIHSVRAVDPSSACAVASWADERAKPLHCHVSEQPGENVRCREELGAVPTAVLAGAGALTSRFTAVHFTHVGAPEIGLLGEAGACCCLCPTTERSLADGIGPAEAIADAGASLALGSDSHAMIDHFEEARAVELDQRLVTRRRGHHHAADLLRAATAGGYDSLGWSEGGRLVADGLADLVTLRLDGVRMAGAERANALDAAVFSASAADVTHVIVGGRVIVRDGSHTSIDVPAELATSLGSLRE